MFPVARAAQSLVGNAAVVTHTRYLQPHHLMVSFILAMLMLGTHTARIARGIQHTLVRQAHRKHEPTFHDKYGTMFLLGGAAMFSAVWGYVLTQLNIEWGFSPIGRITPREWRE